MTILQEWTWGSGETDDFAVAEGYSVQLTFLKFNLEPHSSCEYDYVEISYGDYSQKLCGDRSVTDLVYTSTSNTMTLKMKTDQSETRKGFKACWVAVEVSATTTSTTPLPFTNDTTSLTGTGKNEVNFPLKVCV